MGFREMSDRYAQPALDRIGVPIRFGDECVFGPIDVVDEAALQAEATTFNAPGTFLRTVTGAFPGLKEGDLLEVGKERKAYRVTSVMRIEDGRRQQIAVVEHAD